MPAASDVEASSIVHDLVVEGFRAVDRGLRVVDPPITADFSLTMGDRSIDADAYRQFVLARAEATYVTRHLVSNFHVVERSDERLAVEFVATVHRREADGDRPTTNVVDFADEWVRVDGQWRQRSRTISPVFLGVGA